jgi:hypothetical protein
MSPEKPPIAGELRFRVTSNDVPASFWSGSDLLQLDGRPWSRPLLILLTRYLPLYEKLREDGFVSDDLDADLSTFSTIKYNFTYKSQVLYTINDTFIVDFGIKRGGFTVITEQGAEHIPFTRLFFDSHESIGTPYTGAYTNLHLLY